MTVIYAVLRQMGLPVDFCAGSTRVGARERWRGPARDLLISPVCATRTQMRLGLGSAQLGLDWTRDDATATRRDQVHRRGKLGDYLFNVKYAAIYLSSFTNGTGKCD